jgi:hypothetical protein
MTHSLKPPGFNTMNLSNKNPVSSLCFQMQLVPLHVGKKLADKIKEYLKLIDDKVSGTFTKKIAEVVEMVGLYKLNSAVDPKLESAWFQPLSLKCMPDLSGLYLG